MIPSLLIAALVAAPCQMDGQLGCELQSDAPVKEWRVILGEGPEPLYCAEESLAVEQAEELRQLRSRSVITTGHVVIALLAGLAVGASVAIAVTGGSK